MAETVAGRIKAEALTQEAWAAFGWVPLSDTDPRDGEHRLEFAWGDPHVNLIAHRMDEVPTVAGGLRCEMLYRHETHTQTLMPIDNDCVIAVAPPGAAFGSTPDAAAISAFTLRPLQSLVLHRGTWHWGPFPIRDSEVRLFNVQGLGYRDDNTMMDLAARGLAVDVLTG